MGLGCAVLSPPPPAGLGPLPWSLYMRQSLNAIAEVCGYLLFSLYSGTSAHQMPQLNHEDLPTVFIPPQSLSCPELLAMVAMRP